MEEKSINYNPKGSAEVFHISQNDSNRQIRCNLYDDSSVLNVTSSDNVRVRYKKPDKSIGSLETVEVTVNITHPTEGDLKIELISPDGTVSVLAQDRKVL